MKKKAKKTTCERPKRGGIAQVIKRCLQPKKAKAAMTAEAAVVRLNSSPNCGGTEAGTVIADLLPKYRQTGDSRIASMIFKQFWHLVMGSAMKYLGDSDAAQDAAMDIFQKVLERLRLESPANFPAWLYTVTRNHCVELLRKKSKSPRLEPLEGVRVAMESEYSFVEEQENHILARNVRQALAELPEQQRECVEMFYMQELSYKEISEESGYPVKTVKSFIQNGKRRLKMSLCAFRGQHLSDRQAR